MRPRLTVLHVLVLWTGWFAGVGLSAQNTLFLPCDATSLTGEQKASRPERLAYPTDLRNIVRSEITFACAQPADITHPFSVSPDRQVLFSPGNLQYNAALGTHQCADGTTQPGTWRFAEHQWDYVGDAENGTVWHNGAKCSNTDIGETYNGWIDLFGWGTSGWESGAQAYQPWAASTTDEDYRPGGNEENDLTGSYAYSDWAMYNPIGDDPAGIWRTLTNDEWVWLFQKRADAERLFGLGSVNGVHGTIVLPDGWTAPDGTVFTANTTDYSGNVYSEKQWAVMESAGAVFLPVTGNRRGTEIVNVSERGDVWSSTHSSSDGAYSFCFSTEYFLPQSDSHRLNGRSVRPVKDVTPTPSAYEPKPFSVSADRQITFSPGNLQYNAAKGSHLCADGTTQQGTWRFAEHQWDYVGDAEVGNVYANGVKCDNAHVSAEYDGWIDWFGWGTSGWNSGAVAYQPWATSETNSDYYPGGSMENDLTGRYANADWGVYNAIGDDPAGTWRTLTNDEWVYLFREREKAEKLFGLGTVNGAPGTIILPDEWEMPQGVSFTPSTEKGFIWTDDTHFSSSDERFTDNIYTLAQWEYMESAGAVFLPATGCRRGSALERGNGRYWSSTQASENGAYYFRFHTTYLYPQYYYNRNRGFSVRLVKDTVVVPTYVPKPFSVSANKQVTFSCGNLQYNAAQGTHQCADGSTQQGTWRFADHQWDYVGDTEKGTVYHNGAKCDNTHISDTYNGWIDFFGWGTSGWDSGAKEYQPWATGKANDDYISEGNEESDLTGSLAWADWGMYNEINGDTPGTWRSLTKEESYYLLVGRAHADRLFGFGTVNGISGLILLPDEWTTPSEVTFASGGDKGMEWDSNSGLYNSDNGHFADNVYTDAQWRKMENAGAVFLPAAGYRRETKSYYIGQSGHYWLVSYGIRESAHGACYMNFPSNRLYPERHHYRYNGGSLRLVKDIAPTPPPSAYEPKPFSVSADRQITFAPGNLQYNAAQGSHQCADGTTQQGTWRFAEHQWDIAGMGYGQTNKDNHCYIGGTVQNGDNRSISETYDGWTDLFGWGTSGWNSGAAACQPWATSVTNSDYHPGGSDENNLTGDCANADWGVYNRIGDDGPGTWRTLTYDEWNYLINTRTNAGSKFGVARVNGMTGVVILPDDFTLLEDCDFTPGMTNASDWYDWSYVATTNIYTSAQWQLMEAAGAVFLPCAGDRNRALVFGAGAAGRYWLSTANNSDNAYYVSFSSDGLHTYANYRYRGFSVRLVKDQTPPPPPSAYNPQPFSISADRQITFSPGNLQYNAALGTHQCADGTTKQGTWRFAEHQWDYVGDTKNGTVYHNGTKCSNTKISSKYDGWIDLFAWGTSGWDSGAKNYRPWNEGKTNSNYLIGGKVENDMRGEYSNADWGVFNDIMNGTKTDPAGTWHTMTENDWAYIVLHRPNAAELFALATVNGVKGMILLPDNWNPADKPHIITSTEQGFYVANDTIYNDQRGSFESNILSVWQWLPFEAAGAVFLPCAGHRHDKTLKNVNEWGDYSPSTNMAKRYRKSKYELPVFFFSDISCKPGCPSDVRYCGKSIRLVCDYQPSSTVPPRSTVAADYWTPYTEYWPEEPEHWISIGHRTATAELWTDEAVHRTPKPERKTPKEDDPEEDNYVEEPADTLCWQPSYRFHDYDYPLPDLTACRDRDYVAYTLEYFDKDACMHYLKDIVIATTEAGTVELYDTICDGTPYDFFGDQLTKTDVYTHTVPIARDCEQVYILHLTVHPSYSGIEQTEYICPSGSFVWNGAEYTDEGDYTLSLSSANGCDSLVTLHLRHYPSYECQLTDTLLTGQTLLFEGTELAAAGTYSVTLPTVDGCDSVITLMLEENAVQVLSAECNDLCSDKEELHISLDFTGTAHSVRLTFDSAAHVAGWRDTLIVLTDDDDIVLPARGCVGQFTCTAELLFRDTTAASVTIPFTLPYPSSVLKQLWDDGVAVMNSDYNGGYDFVAFQWYENGVPLAGETASILYRPLIMGGEYSALLTESNGRQMLCCPLIATSRTALETPDIGITIWPTLASPSETIRCHAEQPAELTVYDIHGRTVDRFTVPAGTSVFSAPVVPGLYMVLMQPLHSGRAATVKIIVSPCQQR
ncbi:MAG: hypothetical protein K5660_00740 [Paludibacteraceae bacterium]|nr:hypothetical protein [Paludibacteraceae bacterium]